MRTRYSRSDDALEDTSMPENEELSPDEVESQIADVLPAREAMSLIDPSSAMASGYEGLLGDGSAPSTTTADPASGTATGTADHASTLTDGAANPTGGYSPSATSTA
jgi:hypothetical protein